MNFAAQVQVRPLVRRLAMPIFMTVMVGIGVGVTLWKEPEEVLPRAAAAVPRAIPQMSSGTAPPDSPQAAPAEGAAADLALAQLRQGLRGAPDQGKGSSALTNDLDRQHRAEPIDPYWSARSETDVMSAAILPIMIDSGPTPQGFTTDCRSRSCRISATFESGGAAQDWGINLITQMGATLGQSRMLLLPLPDGRVEVRVYGSRKMTGPAPVQSMPRASGFVASN